MGTRKRNLLILDRAKKGLIPAPFSEATANLTLPELLKDESAKNVNEDDLLSPLHLSSLKKNQETISDITGVSFTELFNNTTKTNDVTNTPKRNEQNDSKDSDATYCEDSEEISCPEIQTTTMDQKETPAVADNNETATSLYPETLDETQNLDMTNSEDHVDTIDIDEDDTRTFTSTPSMLNAEYTIEIETTSHGVHIVSQLHENINSGSPRSSVSKHRDQSVKLSIPLTDTLLERLESSKNIDNVQPTANLDLPPSTVSGQNILCDLTTAAGEFSENDDPFAVSGAESTDEYKPEKKKRRKHRLSSSSSSSGTSSSSSSTSSSSDSSSSGSSTSNLSSSSSKKKGKKRKRNVQGWKCEVRKALKNSGKKYVSATGKTVEAKTMRPPCTDKCRLSCSSKFSSEARQHFFYNYWALSSLQRQRDFLSGCTSVLQTPNRRIKATATKPRKPNCFFSLIKDGKNVRVCKTFFMNTLGIKQRTLRTVIEAKTSDVGIVPIDKRGKHFSHCKVDPEIRQSVRDHINSIPRIESHYLRANTSREFIDGGLSIAEMHRNYTKEREAVNKKAANYDFYARIFNTEFNISFFIPKKDQCDECEAHKNAVGEEKKALEASYIEHHRQKDLSRKEKKKDLEECKKTGSNSVVAIFDLQAVMPVPVRNSSAFYYKSKINCYNFTICDMKNECTQCYFWHEGIGNRGAIEIGSCLFHFMKQIAEAHPDCDLIFYSDNCCGQQKNRFVFTMYYYAVMTLAIKSVTHKFLIRGHTQNEGDSAHSTIERSIKKAKNSGPIYVPDQYIQLIRGAKKRGKPFEVHELSYDDFSDLKILADEAGVNFAKDANGQPFKILDTKIIKFVKDSATYTAKYAYDADWIEIPIKNTSGRSSRKNALSKTIDEIRLKPAYTSKIRVTGKKKDDILVLLQKNIVPRHYSYFYDSIF